MLAGPISRTKKLHTSSSDEFRCARKGKYHSPIAVLMRFSTLYQNSKNGGLFGDSQPNMRVWNEKKTMNCFQTAQLLVNNHN